MMHSDLLERDNLVGVLASGTVDLPVRALPDLLDSLVMSDGPRHVSPIPLRSRKYGRRNASILVRCLIISWIFWTMESVGDASEDPFENFINDVPMTALCRTIEIDLKEMLREEEIPAAIQAKKGVLM